MTVALRSKAEGVVGAVVERGFQAGSRLRGAKFFHPDGVVHEATVRITSAAGAPRGSTLLTEPRTYDALARFSRGAGVPQPIPDVLGFALRMLDAHGEGRHQDILMVTSGNGPLVQHLLLPSRSFTALPYSTVLPYRSGDESFVIGARALTSVGAENEFAELARLTRRAGPHFELCVAPVGGRLRPVGEITIGDRLEDSANDMRFNPWNTGGGLRPGTFFNRMRAFAYPGSQRGRAGD